MAPRCPNLHCKIITEGVLYWLVCILSISGDLVTRMNELALALGLQTADIRQIERQTDNTFDFLTLVLTKWISKEGPDRTTVEIFTSVLTRCHFNNVVADIIKGVNNPEFSPFKNMPCLCNNLTTLTRGDQGYAITIDEVSESRSPDLPADPPPGVSTDPDQSACPGPETIEMGTPLLQQRSSNLHREYRRFYDVECHAWESLSVGVKCVTISIITVGILCIIVGVLIVLIYVSVNKQNSDSEYGSDSSTSISAEIPNNDMKTPMSLLLSVPITVSAIVSDSKSILPEKSHTLVMTDHIEIGSLDCKHVSHLQYAILSTDAEQPWFETCDTSSIQHLTLIGDFTYIQISQIFSTNLQYSVETLNFTGPHICKEFVRPQICTSLYVFKNLRKIIFWGNVSECTELYKFLAECANFKKSCDIILDRNPDLRLGERDRNAVRDKCRGKILIVKS